MTKGVDRLYNMIYYFMTFAAFNDVNALGHCVQGDYFIVNWSIT